MAINWNEVRFKASYGRLSECPRDDKIEFSLIGRSNVGKSSLINALLKRKGIAKISGTPGKTQTLNYFDIDGQFYMVDLPGYGYAKVSKTKRALFKKLIDNYIFQRPNMVCTFVLLDTRVKPMQTDMDFINSLAERQIPQVLVFTKADKLKPDELEANMERYHETLSKYWHDLPQEFITSSKTGRGIDDLRAFIENCYFSILEEQ